jgi:hypothetical protein
MGNLTEHKLHLIQQISAIDNTNELVIFLEKELKGIKTEKEKEAEKGRKTIKAPVRKNTKKLTYEDLEARAMKPMRKFDEEAIMKEQGWTGKHDKEGIMRLIKDMNVQEPIEELLALLTK